MPESITNARSKATSKGVPAATPEQIGEQAARAEVRLGDDEVSLRELYLIFKRGLPWIVGAALLAGTLAFATTLRRTPVFATGATVLVSPLPLEGESSEGAQRLRLEQSGAVPFEAYRKLALSDAVLTDALNRESNAAIPKPTIDVAGLRAVGSLRRDTRPNQTGEDASLMVTHVLTLPNPERAAALADAWAQSTVAAVHGLRSATLREIEAATRAAATQLEATLQDAETQLQNFQAQAEGLGAARVEGLSAELVEGERELRALSRRIDASRARLETLRAQRQTNTPSSVADVQREEITLSGLLAERESLQAQLGSIEATLETQPTAETDQQRQLSRDVERAETAFQRISDVQTRAAYLRELVPSTAQLLDRASVPTSPVATPGTSRILLAAFAGALLATLLIFLRAATAPPKTPTPQPSHSSQRTPATISESRGQT